MIDNEILHYRLRVMTYDLETMIKDQTLLIDVRWRLQEALLALMKANIELLRTEPCEQKP